MLSNMATSLILHKRITTTVAKAKALRLYVEPLITKAKEDTTHSRRVVFSYLRDKFAITELFRNISGKIADRPGGYTRIIKLGKRQGDNAEMALIELVDYNELLLSEKKTAKKSTRRRRGGSKKTVEAVVETVAVEETKTAETAEVAEPAKVEEVKVEEAPAKEEAKVETKVEDKPKPTEKKVKAETKETETKSEEDKEEKEK